MPGPRAGRDCFPSGAALALLTGAAQAGAAAPEGAKATPAASAPAAQGKAATAKPPASAKKKTKLVNLNAASPAELRALPGGSDAEAARIIAGRPYNSKTFLVTNKIISEGRDYAIKNLVVAGEPAKPAAAQQTRRSAPPRRPRDRWPT